MEKIETNKTDTAVPAWTRWLTPSIADVIFIFLFLNVLSLGSEILRDADIAWHIRTGDYILSRMEVPRTDIFSYRKYGETWIAHEWLSDVVFSFLHRFAGLNGIVILSAFIIASTFFLLFKMLQARSFNLLVVTVVTMLAAVTSSNHWLARPHLFSMLLTLLWSYFLESHQRLPQKKHFLLFPALMVLWVNLHGGYLVGLILIAIYGVGNMINNLIAVSRGLQPDKKQIDSLVPIGLFSFLAALINPYGYRLLLFPFEVLGSRAAMETIVEWQSPSFHRFGPYELYLLLLVATFLISSQRLNLIEVGITLFAIHISLVSQRYIPIFAILMAPILGQRLDAVCRTWLGQRSAFSVIRGAQNRILESVERLEFLNAKLNHHTYAVALCLVMLFLAQNGGRAFGHTVLNYKFQSSKYPISAVDFVKQNAVSGRMYNDYVFGGYLIYSFFPDPRYRVFVDGRAIVGGDDYFTEYLKVSQLTPQWESVLEKYQVNWIIEETNSILTLFLAERHDWKLVYSDTVASIFVKNVPENRYLIEKYSGVKPVFGKNE
jgi:hypothetical protein